MAGANTQYTKEPEREKGSDVMLARKKAQKRPAATTAHLDELLDEALKATFPASDPIAIDVELESGERGMAPTRGFRVSPRSKAPLTR